VVLAVIAEEADILGTPHTADIQDIAAIQGTLDILHTADIVVIQEMEQVVILDIQVQA
jgi:hypothetical protein